MKDAILCMIGFNGAVIGFATVAVAIGVLAAVGIVLDEKEEDDV